MPSPETKISPRTYFTAGVLLWAAGIAGAYIYHHGDHQSPRDPHLEQKQHDADKIATTKKLGEMGVSHVLDVEFDAYGKQYVVVGISDDPTKCRIHLKVLDQSNENDFGLEWLHLDSRNHVIHQPIQTAAEVKKAVEATCM